MGRSRGVSVGAPCSGRAAVDAARSILVPWPRSHDQPPQHAPPVDAPRSPSVPPEANTDFITAAIHREPGMIGLAAVLVLYLLLIMRGLKAAMVCRDPFGTLLAAGLPVALQVFIVVGG